jgi:hypothetical protein
MKRLVETRASLLEEFKPDFTDVVLFDLDELLSLVYMYGKLEIFCFHPNLNYNKILFIASNMVQSVHEDQVSQVCSDHF